MKNTERDYRALVLTAVVMLLLLLYAAILGHGIVELFKLHKGPVTPGEMRFQSQFAAIGGLVSAIVVAALGIKTRQARINLMHLFGDPNPPAKAEWMTWAYVAVWFVLGTAALLMVWTLPSATDIPISLKWIEEYSKTFFGTALAAGYAYFNLTPAPLQPAAAPPS